MPFTIKGVNLMTVREPSDQNKTLQRLESPLKSIINGQFLYLPLNEFLNFEDEVVEEDEVAAE